jgi:hypothetical protein
MGFLPQLLNARAENLEWTYFPYRTALFHLKILSKSKFARL